MMIMKMMMMQNCMSVMRNLMVIQIHSECDDECDDDDDDDDDNDDE